LYKIMSITIISYGSAKIKTKRRGLKHKEESQSVNRRESMTVQTHKMGKHERMEVKLAKSKTNVRRQ
jgi:hypothetical protein